MCLLWLQRDTPIDATSFLGRRECHRLLLISAVACKVGDLGIFSIGRHCDKVPDLLMGGPIPPSFMADWSGSRSGLGSLPQQPLQMNLSASFHPHSVVCRNISWRITDQWGAPNSYLGYSSRNNSASSLHSASLTESPTSIACSLAVWDLFILPP